MADTTITVSFRGQTGTVTLGSAWKQDVAKVRRKLQSLFDINADFVVLDEDTMQEAPLGALQDFKKYVLCQKQNASAQSHAGLSA